MKNFIPCSLPLHENHNNNNNTITRTSSSAASGGTAATPPEVFDNAAQKPLHSLYLCFLLLAEFRVHDLVQLRSLRLEARAQRTRARLRLPACATDLRRQ